MTQADAKTEAKLVKVQLYGAEAEKLEANVGEHGNLSLVEDEPDVVNCYGGDGTLLSAERLWPGVPKAPILNSRGGHKCIPHPPAEVIGRLAEGSLVSNAYTKIECALKAHERTERRFSALNEFHVHMGRINSAVRFRLWLNDDPYDGGIEILGDGFVVCTPFGSTAYYSQLTRGIFTTGLGVAFKSTGEHVNHLVLPDDVVIRALITRGPAVLAYDSSTEYLALEENDELVIRKQARGAIILTCGPPKRLDEPF